MEKEKFEHRGSTDSGVSLCEIFLDWIDSAEHANPEIRDQRLEFGAKGVIASFLNVYDSDISFQDGWKMVDFLKDRIDHYIELVEQMKEFLPDRKDD